MGIALRHSIRLQKYDLHMKVVRYVSDEQPTNESFIRK